MSDFETIENEFLSIDPYDKENLKSFYEKHKNYFDSAPPPDIEELKRCVSMLTEIGATLSLNHQHKTALLILDKAINLYKENRERLGNSPDVELGYDNAISSKGFSLLELKQYFRAKQLLKQIKNMGDAKRLEQLKTILIICDWKIKNRVAIVLGVIGLLILIVKFSIKWFFPEYYSYPFVYSGFLGSSLIITFGLLYKTKIKHALTDVQIKAG